MMDSLILDSLSTPYTLTKITTHRPVKKATSSTNLPTNNNGSSSTMRTQFSSTNNIHKKIPTQGTCLLMIYHHFMHLLLRPSHTSMHVC